MSIALRFGSLELFSTDKSSSRAYAPVLVNLQMKDPLVYSEEEAWPILLHFVAKR